VFNKIKRLIFRALAAAVVIVPVTAGTAFSHKFIAGAWVEEDSVFIEAAFGTGEPGKNAEVIVFDEGGNTLLATATDENGECSFKIPQKSALKIIVNAGMGHQANLEIPLAEIEEAFGGQGIPVPETAESEAGAAGAPDFAASAPVTGISAREIQTIIDNALDKKLKPLIRKLSMADQGGPGFKDIAGGIGYILGLVGVGTYFNYRRKQRD